MPGTNKTRKWKIYVNNMITTSIDAAIEGELTPMVKKMIAQQLNDSGIRHQVADTIGQIPALQSLLFANHGWEIVGITDVGNAFRLDMERLLSPSFGAAVNAGSSCPKPITIVASATTRVPLDMRVQYRIDGGTWSSWLALDKLTEATSNLVHASRSITTGSLNPGTRLVEARIKPFGEFLWQVETYEFSKTLEVTCPLKEVSEVELTASTSSFIYMDQISKLETDCPVTIGFLGRFTEHDGAGDVSYRFRFSEGNRVSTTYSTTIEHPMLHPGYKTPTTLHELPFPLPVLPQPDDPPAGDVGGFQMQQPPAGPQTQGGFQATGGALPGNEHKGSVRLEVVTPQGGAVSDWLPYHIVCKPKTTFTPVGPLTAPQKPVQPATRGAILTTPQSAPPAAGSGLQEQQPARPGEQTIPRRGLDRSGERNAAPAPTEEPARTRDNQPGPRSVPGFVATFGAGLRRQVGEANSDRSSESSRKPSAEAGHDRNANAETNYLLGKPAQGVGEQARDTPTNR